MRTILLALALSAACATAAVAAPPIAPEPAKRVDATTFFAGRWYEIGRTPMSLTDGCVAGYTDYLRTGGGLVERDGCRDKGDCRRDNHAWTSGHRRLDDPIASLTLLLRTRKMPEPLVIVCSGILGVVVRTAG